MYILVYIFLTVYPIIIENMNRYLQMKETIYLRTLVRMQIHMQMHMSIGTLPVE